ncbi:MAG: alpha/beta fold hydrolase, partial [Candidatus Aquilonibacter sp.]
SASMNRRAFAAGVGASVAGSMLGACSPATPRALPGEPPRLSYADSVRAIRAVIAHDAADTTLIHDALPRLYEHGGPVENAIILFHGFTNCPQQFDVLARQFYARGCNVYVPRIPRHGQSDRLTTTLADLTIEELGKSTLDAFAYARGLGRRVSSVGLSLGGSMSLWLAQAMPIDLAVAVSPFLMPIGIPRGVGTVAMHTLYTIPSMYWWWDPRVKQNCLPTYAYPGYPTHGLAEVTFFGDRLFAYSGGKPLGKACILVTNANESAVNNSVSRDLLAQWKSSGADVSEIVLSGLGPPRHDIIDPTTFPQGVHLVYPRLMDMVLG